MEPKSKPDSNIRPSFNVTFGIFTCADLIYKYPAVAMVEDRMKILALT